MDLHPTQNSKLAQLTRVALLYFGEGLTQGEIARRLGISRPTVIAQLKEAKESGIVEIHIASRNIAQSKLSRQLVEEFGLIDAYVWPSEPGQADEVHAKGVAFLAAMTLAEIVADCTSLGVAWGQTIQRLAREIPSEHRPDLKVYQLIGAMESDRLDAAESCTIEVAKRLGAKCHTLHAPAIVSSEELATALRSEPIIETQLRRLIALDAVLFSVGDMGPSTHIVTSGICTLDEVEQARQNGAKAIVCGRFMDARGRKVSTQIDKRLIAIEVDILYAARKRILVAAEMGKLEATRAVLNGGLASHLVVNKQLAQALL